MCFSSTASLVAGGVLLPVGVYCVSAALRKNQTYLPLAVTPILFGVQQVSEAAVWHGLEHQHADLLKVGSLTFLFFAIAFWPGWIPLLTAVIETGWRRKLCFVLSVIGFALGFLYFGPAVWNFEEWVVVRVDHHSIKYDLTRLPFATVVETVILQLLYLALICVPFSVCRNWRVQLLGATVAIAAVVTYFVFTYAFVSVWCFLAAFLSAQIGYICYRLPTEPLACPSD